jgi:glycosyltransferase involved in cell wall biosynthesis
MKESPGIWFNLTSSRNWTRPPVGIIRVEQSIYSNLCELCEPGQVVPCAWEDGAFKSFGEDSGRILPPGAILLTMGLDWDQPYKNALYDLRKKQSVTVITCCYDLIPVLFPQYCVGDVAAHFKEYFAAVTWGSSGVLCISRNSERDYLALCKDSGWRTPPTCVMPLADNLPDESGDISSEIRNLCSEPLILFVSTIERRKNHQCLVQAYHFLRRTRPELRLPKLVFVGMPGWGVGDLLKDIELDPLTKGYIVLLHHVSDPELRALYTAAMLCVYPSFYEGWGLPLGEALAMGKPVFSSDAGSLPEVGGDLVRYISPFNPSAWAEAIGDALENPEMLEEQASRVAVGYQGREWKDTAEVVLNFAEECHARDSKVRFPLTLYPGYDCSTIEGTHCGASIAVPAQASGIAMFGPYISLPAGVYRIIVRGTKHWGSPREMEFEILHGSPDSPTLLCHGPAIAEQVSRGIVYESSAVESCDSLTHLQVRCGMNSSSTALLDTVIVECLSSAIFTSRKD